MGRGGGGGGGGGGGERETLQLRLNSPFIFYEIHRIMQWLSNLLQSSYHYIKDLSSMIQCNCERQYVNPGGSARMCTVQVQRAGKNNKLSTLLIFMAKNREKCLKNTS